MTDETELPDPSDGKALRRIEPIEIADLDIGEPEHEQPICELVDPRDIYVDPAYQRDISDRGRKLIQRIIEGWDWNKFQPPGCTYAEHEGKTVLKCFDGQHTSIAAASHPKIDRIPVMIHIAPDTADQASAFVGQNSGRLAVSALQMHAAALIAGDPDAVTIDQVCRRAGVRVLRFSVAKFEPGDTVAISAIASIVDKRGAMKARIILEVLAKAGFTPIVAAQIRAVELLLTDAEYRDAITPEDLTEAIKLGWLVDHDEAKQLTVAHRWPFWRALAIVWFRRTKKRRGSAKSAA